MVSYQGCLDSSNPLWTIIPTWATRSIIIIIKKLGFKSFLKKKNMNLWRLKWWLAICSVWDSVRTMDWLKDGINCGFSRIFIISGTRVQNVLCMISAKLQFSNNLLNYSQSVSSLSVHSVGTNLDHTGDHLWPNNTKQYTEYRMSIRQRQCINNQCWHGQGTRMHLPLCLIKTLRQNQRISESELRFERGGNVPQHHVMDNFSKISLEISLTKTKHMSIDFKYQKCYTVTTKN